MNDEDDDAAPLPPLPAEPANPLRILHLEDSPRDAEFIRERLGDAGFSMQLDWASDEREFTAFLRRGGYDLILADYELPGFDALAALGLAKSLCPGVPFICVSGTIGEERAVKLLREGATDYVLKGRLEKLPLVLRRALDEFGERNAHKRAEEALRQSEEQYRQLVDKTDTGFVVVDVRGIVTAANEPYSRLAGAKGPESLIGRSVIEWTAPDEREKNAEAVALCARQGFIKDFETAYQHGDGRRVDIIVNATTNASPGDETHLLSYCRDITERKRLETFGEISRQVLQILNSPDDCQDSLRRSLATIKRLTGFDAVGMRLRDGEDFPYFAQEGFSNDFLLTENTLVERGADGGVRRDGNGNVRLECTCGLVISGRTDPSNPLFTRGGSFWTNDSSALLELPADQDPRLHPRNHCIHQGHASVALVPIRTKDQTIGLLQFNARRPGCFSIAAVEKLEDFAAHVGNALMRKQTEEMLRESEGKYRALFEHSRDALMTLAPPSWGYTSGNQAAVYMFRAASEKEFISCAPWDLSPERQPDGRVSAEKAGEMIETVLREGGHFFEWTHKRLDGGEFPATVLLTRFEHDGRQVVQATVRDITEQKRQEEEKTRLLAIMDESPDFIGVADLQGNLLYHNRAAKMMVGLPADADLSHLKIADMHPDWAAKLVLEEGIPAILRGEVWRSESAVLHRNGTETPVSQVLSAHRDSSGQQTLIFTIMHDISERKKAEKERESLQVQLNQAQKMESVGRLAGGVAHDFNNMLAVILGYTEVALGQLHPDLPLHGDLEEVHKAGKRAADLTRQLLAFARKQVVMPKIMDLNECAGGMLKMLQRLIGENIQLNWQPGADLWPVMMDPSQVDQILANLCVNARDAIVDVGRITIETKNRSVDEHYSACHAGLAPGEYVTLAVSDTGCGMDRETQNLIFEPFFTTKEMGKGTGLGLATVFGIVKQNSGHINVYSEVGRGTTFTIYLPRHAGEAEKAGTQNVVEANLCGNETILLVEDEPSFLALAAVLLERHGYTVLSAGSPREALRLAGEHSGEIRLLMTDVVMPEMNGRDLAHNLSSLIPQVKCLFTSGYTADVIARQGVLDEGVHFIQKPFSVSGLANKVREVLDNE